MAEVALITTREFIRRADAKRQRAGAPAVELEQRAVLGDEDIGARRDGRFDELLVVGVAALRQAGALGGGEGKLDALREAARLRERRGLPFGADAVPAEAVGQPPPDPGIA